jgi:hypothetical protein
MHSSHHRWQDSHAWRRQLFNKWLVISDKKRQKLLSVLTELVSLGSRHHGALVSFSDLRSIRIFSLLKMKTLSSF